MKNYLTIILLLTVSMMTRSYGQDFYDISTVNTIEITFEESNWDYLLDQLYAAGDEERLIGTVEINGQVFDSVGVRYKGNSTYSANQVKNPFNIKLDHVIDDQTIDGYGTIKLANVYNDPSFVREVMGYEIARDYFPASQSNYANVYVNGTHLGLYTNDQSVDKFFMQNSFGSDENTRIKGELTSSSGVPSGSVWEYFGTDSSDYANYYELKSDYGWENLINMLDTLSNHNEYIDELLNTDRHLWFIAFSNLLVNLDGPINNPQNYYLYQDDNNRFNTIPWDLNESFGVFSSHQTLGNLSTYEKQHMTPFANENESDFPIISKILSNDTYKKIYVAHMKTIIEDHFSDGQYEARALEIQDIIDEDVQNDDNKFFTYNDFIDNIDNTVTNGPQQSIVGITQLMDTRVEYIMGLSDFEAEAPAISNVSHGSDNVSSGTEVWITAELEAEEDVELAYRSSTYGVFEKVPMYDDGNHEDGSAGDGVYGASIVAGSTDIQYYIFAENSDAVAFSPEKAEYEFYSITVTGNLVINEFMADNESYITDQDGDYDDWIELYNNSESDINLEGYYLSDDSSEPDVWSFPDTTITAGGYLIVWADKDEEQDGLHAEIKLSADGEMIILSDSDLNLIDEVTFGVQKPDTTTGRYPNGTGDFAEMLPTFESANNNIITAVEEIDFISNVEIKAYPNPFKNEVTLEFSLDSRAEVSVEMYNIFGQVIQLESPQQYDAGTHTISYSTNNLSAGIWICKLTIDGETITKKLMKL